MSDQAGPLEAALADHPPPANPIPASRLLGFFNGILLFGVALLVTYGYKFGRVLTRDPRADAARATKWIHRWGRFGFRLLGWRLTVEGPRPAPGALIAPNHVGYCDMICMAAAGPSYFVAQRALLEVPLFGLIAKTFDHPLTSRMAGRDLIETAAKVREKLERGQSVCAFLEGTSGPGDRVWSFHPALVQPAIECGAAVVPVAILWRATAPGVVAEDDIAFWRPEHKLGPHLLRLLGLPPVECTVRYGPAIPSVGKDRKVLTAEARAAVVALSGLRDLPQRPLEDRKRLAEASGKATA